LHIFFFSRQANKNEKPNNPSHAVALYYF
jgi:hypothetical protein